MINEEKAYRAIAEAYPDMMVHSMLKGNNKFIFSLVYKDESDDNFSIDNFYCVDSNYDVGGYSPVDDPEEFKEAMKHSINFSSFTTMTHNYVYFSNDYLQHHGIQGQKWGVRRYQNEDGTLTEEGRKRYGSEERRSEMAKVYKDTRKQSIKDTGTLMGVRAATVMAIRTLYTTAANSPLILAAAGGNPAIAAGGVALAVGASVVAGYLGGKAGGMAVSSLLIPKDMDKSIDKLMSNPEYADLKIEEFSDDKLQKAIKRAAGDYSDETLLLDHSDSSDLYLEHHGILGQKWGVRRYQNEDGTLTPLGAQKRNSIRDYTDEELRREIDRTRLEKEYNREMGYGSKYYKGKAKKKPFSKKVNVSAMDDDELEAYVNRRYLEMKAEDADRAEVEKGINYINNLMRTAGNVVSTASSIASLVNTISNTKASIDNNKFAKEQRELEKKRMAKYYNDASRLDEQELLARTRTEQNRWAYVNARSGKSGQSSKNDQSKSKPKNKQQGRRLKVTGIRFS